MNGTRRPYGRVDWTDRPPKAKGMLWPHIADAYGRRLPPVTISDLTWEATKEPDGSAEL